MRVKPHLVSLYDMNTKWSLLLSVHILCGVTIIFSQSADRFDEISPQLLLNSAFSRTLENWEHYGSENITVEEDKLLIKHSISSSSGISQTLLVTGMKSHFLKASILARIGNVHSTKEKNSGASSTVVLVTEEGEWVQQTPLFKATTSRSIRQYSKLIKLNKDTRKIIFTIRLLESNGEIASHSPILQLFKESQSHIIKRTLLIAVWLLLLCFILLITVYKTKRLLRYLLIISIVAATLAATAPPEWLELPRRISATHFHHNPLFEIGAASHLILFLTAGLISAFYINKIGFAYVVATLLTAAISTECIQLLVDHRNTTTDDLTLDLIGACLGLCIGLLLKISLQFLHEK